EGSCDKSYGIQVAKLAGIPAPIITRAEEILRKLSDEDPLTTERIKLIGEKGIASPGPRGEHQAMKQKTVQTILFPILKEDSKDPVMKSMRDEIEKVDIDSMTPLQALAMLKKFKDMTAQDKKK
nr:hypothetical protein [Candidatus Sigynarchaeota archaeon]